MAGATEQTMSGSLAQIARQVLPLCPRPFGALITVALLIVLTVLPAGAAPISIDFNADQDFEQDGGSTSSVQSGEPSHSDTSLTLPGQVGPWADLTMGNGDTGDAFSAERSITTDSITFTFNPGGIATYATLSNTSGDDLRGSLVFLKFGTGGGVADTSGSVEWNLSGLQANLPYDLILFGQLNNAGNATNPADFSIDGHDAGNGVGQPVTPDGDRDGNFTRVFADGSGTISGTFALRSGEAYGSWSGLQLEIVPEPTSVMLLAWAGLLLIGRRRHAGGAD